jgi:hypothetical protein
MAAMSELPKRSAEEALDAIELDNAIRMRRDGALSIGDFETILRRISRRQARRAGHLTPTPEPRVASAPQRKDPSWPPENSSNQPPALELDEDGEIADPELRAQVEAANEAVAGRKARGRRSESA